MDYIDEPYDNLNKWICSFGKVKWTIVNNPLSLKIGDIIYTTYMPYSQRYLDDTIPKYGTVIEIINGKEIYILNKDNLQENIFYDIGTPYSDNFAYEITIYKLDL